MRIIRATAHLAVLALLFRAASAVGQINTYGLDYYFAPVPPTFVQDANTTFLVNLTSVKTQADFALGNPQLIVDTNAFVPGAGCQGTVGFSTAGNFTPNAWTVEMILKVPYASASITPIELFSWTNNNPFATFELALSPFGVQTRIYCPEVNFYAQPWAGGNGQTIQNSATDKWIYVAFGCDFSAQQIMSAAREVTGDILNQSISFLPVSQVLGTNWAGGEQTVAQYTPPVITLGNAGAGVQIQAIRFSNMYRSNVFQATPLLSQPNATNWTPQTIDATRTQFQTVTRNIGYNGANNFIPTPVNEPYLPLAPGAAAITINLTNVPVGLYTFFVWGDVDPQGRTRLGQVWQPCPLDFEARYAGLGGGELARGRMLLKQSFVPRRMQGFHMHVDQPGSNITATFSIPATALETALIQQIVLFDDLAGLPDAAIKTSQNIATGPSNQLSTLTLARQQRDDAIWNALPPLNTQMQADGTVNEFLNPPVGVTLDTWTFPGFLTNTSQNQQYANAFDPLDLVDTNTGVVFPASSLLAGTAWPGPYPDDGTGIFFPQTVFPTHGIGSGIYNTPRAELLGYRYVLYALEVMNTRGTFSLYGAPLPLAYFTGGDPNVGHDGAMALVRWAYDWPALEMSLHDARLCTQSPDLDAFEDWSSEFSVREGKLYDTGTSGDHALWLFEAYDQLFPYIKGNQVLADEVHRFVPWVNTPQDVIRLLDRFLVWSSVRDVQRGLIDGSVGVADSAGQVLGPGPLTASLFDLATQFNVIYPDQGSYQELYGTALSRSGVYYIGSFEDYAFSSAESLIAKAALFQTAKQTGVALPMDLSNVSQYPKVRGAGNFLLNMWVAGGFPFMIGDSSGGPHDGSFEATNRLNTASPTLDQAFALYGDPRIAWVLTNIVGETNAAVAAAAAGATNPVLRAVSRVVPDYGAVLELTPDEINPLKKTAATLRLGIGQGHAHNDYLDLNLFAMGLPLAVDLACRNEDVFWSYPGADWSFLHNHALAHNSPDPSGAGLQSGEPWLRAFAPPLLRASYADQSGTNLLHRDVMLMEVGTGSETYYALDVQRLRGGLYHTWAFHGCESDALQLNVPMQPQTNLWTTRMLGGSQLLGASSNMMQATWTMTRQGKSFAYSYNGGGTLSTVACEQTVLGSAYNSNRPPANVRATLLGRGNDTLMEGDPYSANYAYCFPFLWSQCANETESVYPAVYEWYRGNVPVVAGAQMLQANPLQVRVNTTAGQVDDFEVTTNYFLAVSRDTNGVRWAKLSGSNAVSVAGLSLNPAADYDAMIVDINYTNRTLTTSGPLPANPGVTAGNAARKIFLQLSGSGTTFGWADDLLVQEGLVTALHLTGTNSIVLASDQSLLFDGLGNRSAAAMTVTTEDFQWNFRGGTVIKSPPGVPLTTGVFTDANGDGLIDMKTYEIGVGDHLTLPVDITIQRVSGGWRVKTNVPVTGQVNSTPLNLAAAGAWQDLDNAGKYRPAAPLNLRLLTP